MVFIETESFTRNLQKSAGKDSDSILRAIQDDLLANPMRGDIVQGLGGVRKARVADRARHKGKRGGYRYLFFYLARPGHIHLLYLFGKNQQDDLSDEDKRLLRMVVAQIKQRR
jgi:hypothetical protein